MIARLFFAATVVCLAVTAVTASAQTLLFDDPLTNGVTIGVRDNGQGQFIVGQGWKVIGYSDNIRYTQPTTVEDGSVEFDVVGLAASDNLNPDGQLMTMYDASYNDPRHVYAPDMRLNPYKFVWHRYGDDGAQYHEDEFKMIMNTDGFNQFEDYSAIGKYPWNPATKYTFKVRWRDGVVRYYLNGNETDRWPFYYREVYKPAIHDIRIATNTRDNAIINAIYSNVKIHDHGTVPTAPFVNNPRSDIQSKSLTPIIDWTGERHSQYEVHVTDSSSPTTGLLWDSGTVTSANSYCTAGALSDNTTFHAHVRLRNDKGWGPWSSPRQFQTASGATPVVSRYAEYEIALTTTNSYSNPFTAVTLSATFTGATKTITVNGFWDGGNLYKFRMMPTETGTWNWTTTSNDSQLNGKTGSFTCTASSTKGYVKIPSTYPYTFEWAGDGSPFYLLGDTTWHMWYNIRYSDGSFQSLIDARTAQHFNYMHGVVHDWPHNEGGGIYLTQKATVADPDVAIWDVTTLNPGYFQWVDKKIEYMNSKGMVASLFFSWGNEGYVKDYESVAQYQAYAKYLVARYASRNVIWIIVGEYEEAGQPNSTWITYMDTVYNNDPYKHPISMHTVNTTNAFGATTSHSFVSQQKKGTPEELRSFIASSRVFNKPVVNLEYGYEGDPAMFPANQNADEVRKDHYAITLAGGYGVYGNNKPNYSTYHVTKDFVLTATDTPGARYMKILYEFFSATNFHRLAPSQSLVNLGICAAWANNEYIVQLPSGGSVNLNLTAATGSFYTDWFNPRTGDRTVAGTGATTGGGSRPFTAPDANDWILHVHNYVIAPPEGRVTNFAAIAGEGQVTLSWTNPSDADFTATMIRYNSSGYPTSPTDGTLLVDKANTPGSNDNHIHAGLTNGLTYYYSAFAHDATPTYAPAANAAATPTDLTPPGPVLNFAVTAGDMQNTLSWRNPAAADLTGTMIRYKTTGYPSGQSDGTLLTDKTGAPDAIESYPHAGLTNGTTYYYSAFAHDNAGNFSTKADANGTPTGPYCYSDTFSYPDGLLGGNNNWAGSCSRIEITNQTLKITGDAATCSISKNVSCMGSGGVIWVRVEIRGSIGGATMWSLYIDDPAAKNLARWYGSATSARPRIGGTGLVLNSATLTGLWDTLDVKIDTNNDTDEFFFNGTSLGTLNHSSQGAGNSVGAIRWEATGNTDAIGNYLYFDNLKIGSDTMPPAPVTNLTASGEDGAVSLAWTNPATDFAGTRILCNTTGYPTGPTDGTVVHDAAGTSFSHTGLTNGVKHYYSAFAHDATPNYSPSATANALPAVETTIPGAKALPDTQLRRLKGKVVSAIFAECFYIQEPGDFSGIRALSSAVVSLGSVVDIVGTLCGQGSERYIDLTGNDVVITGPGQ